MRRAESLFGETANRRRMEIIKQLRKLGRKVMIAAIPNDERSSFALIAHDCGVQGKQLGDIRVGWHKIDTAILEYQYSEYWISRRETWEIDSMVLVISGYSAFSGVRRDLLHFHLPRLEDRKHSLKGAMHFHVKASRNSLSHVHFPVDIADTAPPGNPEDHVNALLKRAVQVLLEDLTSNSDWILDLRNESSTLSVAGY